jgi:hypothetical protein
MGEQAEYRQGESHDWSLSLCWILKSFGWIRISLSREKSVIYCREFGGRLLFSIFCQETFTYCVCDNFAVSYSTISGELSGVSHSHNHVIRLNAYKVRTWTLNYFFFFFKCFERIDDVKLYSVGHSSNKSLLHYSVLRNKQEIPL